MALGIFFAAPASAADDDSEGYDPDYYDLAVSSSFYLKNASDSARTMRVRYQKPTGGTTEGSGIAPGSTTKGRTYAEYSFKAMDYYNVCRYELIWGERQPDGSIKRSAYPVNWTPQGDGWFRLPGSVTLDTAYIEVTFKLC